MDIKRIVKSQKLRHRLMRLGSFLPDRIMLPLQYRVLLKRWPNLKDPKRFTEWIQYYKMHYHNPLMLECVDKYTVRNYVQEIIGSEYLINLYCCCKDASELDFKSLPQKFVIKTTSGGNGDNVLIVKDKSNLRISETISKVNSWLRKNYSNTSREWAYSRAANNPLILVEEYIENTPTSLDDYKFYCYNGKFKFLDLHKDRYYNHTRALFNEQLGFIEEVKGNYTTSIEAPSLSENIKEMIIIAEKLAKPFPFVRVDLYNVKGKIYFGELTFYPASGFSPYSPDSFDYELGKYFPDKNDEIWTKYTHAGK